MLASTLLSLHEGFAWFVVIGNGVAGAWALGAHYLETLRHRVLWWFTYAVQFSVFAQVSLGVGLVAGEDIPAPEFHMFYGFLTIVAVMIIYGYRQQMERHRYLLYAGGGLFVMGLGIRAMILH